MNFLKKIIPDSIAKKVDEYYKNKYIIYDKSRCPSIYHEFKNEHIQKTRLLLTREDLINNLSKNGVIAEIGVDEGVFSERIYNISSPKKLYLIDSWESERYNKNKKFHVQHKFTVEIENGHIEIIESDSVSASEIFKNEFFDWIYIDTDHSYKTTLLELYNYSPKIKPNGIIAGHDFIKGNLRQCIRYGVVEAVTEFCVKENWELVFLTVENEISTSFAIRKLLNPISSVKI